MFALTVCWTVLIRCVVMMVVVAHVEFVLKTSSVYLLGRVRSLLLRLLLMVVVVG